MLLSAHAGAVDKVQAPVHSPLPVGPGLQGFQDALPDPGLAPAIEAAGHPANRTVALRQVLPGCPGPEDPEVSVEDEAMVVVRSPGLGLERGTAAAPAAATAHRSIHIFSQRVYGARFFNFQPLCRYALALQLRLPIWS